jgi:hypothetical protein
MHQPEAADDDFLLPVIQYVQVLVNLPFLDLELYFIRDVIGLGPEDVDQALIKPMVPIEIKSSISSPVLSSFLTMCTQLDVNSTIISESSILMYNGTNG